MKIQLDLTPAEVTQLRELMDALPLRPYAPIIVKVTKALPFESVAAHAHGADADSRARALSASRGGGSFALLDNFGEGELQ